MIIAALQYLGLLAVLTIIAVIIMRYIPTGEINHE